MNNPIIVNTIRKHFDTELVINDISFRIQKGQIFGLLGPSGAGKTTIIKMLTGHLQQDTGTIQILGQDNQSLDPHIYEQFGVVLDTPGLYERLSCYDNLALFSDIHQVSKDKIDNTLARVGLLEAKKKAVNQLSKGMKQRLVIARAILHNPKILVLDEPTGALDPSTASIIHQLILEQKELGTAILLTTHNMEEATKLCDEIALLHEGKIIESDSPKNICQKYNHQNTIHITLKNQERVTVSNTAIAAKTVYEYMVKEEIESMHSSEPNLESVFMELTGRKLEDSI